MSAPIVEVAVPQQLDAARRFYDEWGYAGGIAASDRVVLARSGSVVVGVARIAEERGVLVLRGMFLREDHQRRGIGTRMLRALEAQIPSGRSCYCLPYRHLESFYGQIGFETVEPAVIPDFLRERLGLSRAKWGDLVSMARIVCYT